MAVLLQNIFPLFFTLFFVACKQRLAETDKKPASGFTAAPGISIVGNWTINYSSDNGFITQCNVCPVISFNSNRTGSVSGSDLVLETFTWRFTKDVLTILYNDDKPGHTFTDTTYHVSFKSEGLSMVISQKSLKQDFYLAKASLF